VEDQEKLEQAQQLAAELKTKDQIIAQQKKELEEAKEKALDRTTSDIKPKPMPMEGNNPVNAALPVHAAYPVHAVYPVHAANYLLPSAVTAPMTLDEMLDYMS